MAAFTALAIALGIAGTALSAKGQSDAGAAAADAGLKQQEAANSQADLSDYNASVADLQAQDAIERGAQDEAQYRTKIRGAIGTQRANIAGGNVDVGFGSAVDVQGDAAYLGELDALTIRQNAARQAWGYQVQATDLRQSATIARKTGVYAAQAGQERQSAGNLAAVGTLIGGGSSLLGSKYGFGKN